MKIAVKLFARARDLAGCESVEIRLPDEARVADLRTALRERVPALAALVGHLHVAVNSEYAGDERVLRADDEVACFPPVSGG